MTIVHKSVLQNYSAEQMFALVEDIEAYPSFLPWCDSVDVQRDAAHQTAIATLSLNFCGIRQSFTTHNVNVPPTSIKMRLVKGPFKKLIGQWTFTPLDEKSCRVELNLNYEFSHFFMEKLIGPVFDIVTNSLVDAFCERARKVYG